ncbi:hypothetical protein ACNKHT_25325 [Shigella flexneri]
MDAKQTRQAHYLLLPLILFGVLASVLQVDLLRARHEILTHRVIGRFSLWWC